MIVETEWLAIFLLPPGSNHKPQRTRRQKILLTALRASLRFRYCYQDTRRVGFRSIRLAWKGKEHKRPEGAPSQSDPYERNPPGNNISRNRERCRKLSLWKRRVYAYDISRPPGSISGFPQAGVKVLKLHLLAFRVWFGEKMSFHRHFHRR